MVNISFVWYGEDEDTMRRQAELLHRVLEDKDFDISEKIFTKAFYDQVFSEQ